MKKMNLPDWLIIIIVTAGVLFAGYKFILSGSPITEGAKTVRIEYVVECRSKQPVFGDAVKAAVAENPGVFISARERDRGVITNVEVKPAENLSVNMQSKKYEVAQINSLDDVFLTIEAEAVESDTELRVGSTLVQIGAEALISGKGFASEGFVVDLKVLEGE